MESQVRGWPDWHARHQRRIALIFLILFLALFSYAVLDALALLPGEPGFRPGRLVWLAAAMLTQPIARLLRPRFLRTSIALVLLSVIVILTTLAW